MPGSTPSDQTDALTYSRHTGYHAATEPYAVGSNAAIGPLISSMRSAFVPADKQAAVFLRAEIKKKLGIDIDPDRTFLVTLNYNTAGQKAPFPGKIVSKLSLTEVMLRNLQTVERGDGELVAYRDEGPSIRIQADIPVIRPSLADLDDMLFRPWDERSPITHAFQGIYSDVGAVTETGVIIYSALNQIKMSPQQLRDLIWDGEFGKVYTAFLDKFWKRYEVDYPALAKAALIKAAQEQFVAGSLTAQDYKTVARLVRIPDNREWKAIQLAELQAPSGTWDIDAGVLALNGYTSVDLMYLHDKKSGRILLHVPGNSAPLHSFGSVEEMQYWIATEAAVAQKREALGLHFAAKDRPNGSLYAGTDEALAGLGAWPYKRQTPGNWYDRLFSGYWDPVQFITLQPFSGEPFRSIMAAQKQRSYSDAALAVASHADVIRRNVLSGLDATGLAGLCLLPLAILMPEVALGLELGFLASGTAESAIGISQLTENKPEGGKHLFFGLLNALPIAAKGIFKGPKTLVALPEEEEAKVPLVTGSGPLRPISEALRHNAELLDKLSPWKAQVSRSEMRLVLKEGVYTSRGRYFIRIGDEASGSYYRVSNASFNKPVKTIVDPVWGREKFGVSLNPQGRWQQVRLAGGAPDDAVIESWKFSPQDRPPQDTDYYNTDDFVAYTREREKLDQRGIIFDFRQDNLFWPTNQFPVFNDISAKLKALQKEVTAYNALPARARPVLGAAASFQNNEALLLNDVLDRADGIVFGEIIVLWYPRHLLLSIWTCYGAGASAGFIWKACHPSTYRFCSTNTTAAV